MTITTDMPLTDLTEEVRSVVTATRSDPIDALRHHGLLLNIEATERIINEVEAAIASEQAAHEQWLADLPIIASEHANDAEWCTVFDDGLAEFGLERVRQEEEVGWTATVYADVMVDASAIADAAKEQVSGDYDDYSTDSVEEQPVTFYFTVTGSITTSESGCICEHVGWDQIHNNTPAWLDDLGWESGDSVTCDRCN